MAKCNTCGKKYHACSSCYLQNWEYDYCSEDCWNKDPIKVKQLQIMYDLIDSLTEEQIVALFELNADDRGKYLIDSRMEEKLGRKLW